MKAATTIIVTMAETALSLRGVHKSFDGVPAVDGVELRVEAGSLVTLFGPSGCGKSTLLRISAGLLEADSGEVAVFGSPPAAACRAKQIGFVPQEPALLPWRSAAANVKLPLQVNRKANNGVVDPLDLLQRVGLSADDFSKRPSQLSGGMAQRVAIARAFASSPSLLLMDEPFSALDELARESLRAVLLELWEATRKTVVFVTHSATEAVHLSDEIVVLTSRPARVRERVVVTLPRPRPAAIEDTDAFWHLETRVRRALRSDGVEGPARRASR